MVPEELRSLLADSPELKDGLEAICEVDRSNETWTFDDIPVDSGVFGELVAEGVVESVGAEYRLADPEAVDRAINGEASTSTSVSTETGSVSLPAIDWTAGGLLGAILVVTVVIRAASYQAVFRDRVVFAGNDPYYYVYLVEEGLRNGWSPAEIPLGRATEEPLTIVQLLYSAELAGGLGSHRPILAWLPVLIGVVTVLAVYLMACEVTADRRVALGAAFALAVMPVHALRSSLGFVEHHAFDYLWLVIAAWGLTATLRLETIDSDWPTLRAIGLLAAGVAGLVLAWWAGTLLLAPIGLAVLAGGAVAIRHDESFLAPGVATTLGVGGGTSVILLAYRTLGWHDRLIVAIPVVLVIGSALAVAATTVWRRVGLPAWTFLLTGGVAAGGATVSVSVAAPATWTRITDALRRLAGIGFADTAEFQSLFDTVQMGWLFLFGFLLLFAVPYLAWGTYAVVTGNRQWLSVTVYGWSMFGLAISLSRFGGELAPFVAVFAGLGFVHAASWIDTAAPPVAFGGANPSMSVPEPRTALRVAVLIGLICSLSIVMAPVSVSNLSFNDDQYETATFIDRHATEHDYVYPESYVFSTWSWSRMYNYHVNGQARSYGPARSHYRPFSLATRPGEAMERINAVPGSHKYVVTEPIEADVPPEAMQTRLHEHLGSRAGDVEGLAHFRALYVSPTGEYKVFRTVPGATLNGTATPEASVTVSTTVEIEGATVEYTRRVTTDGDGAFALTVPYPGTYDLEPAAGNTTTVSVNETAVQQGATVTVDA